MYRTSAFGLSLAILAFSAMTMKPLAAEFHDLEYGRRVADFTVEAVYENELGRAMGARFRHVPSGFVLDVLGIQSLPQAFTWVNTPAPSDQGEPHTLEHLLLGKGTKGRYVASLEDMRLGRSSAFTERRRTCYHFITAAGPEVFFDLFEKKLDAMLNPNFSDEEIRREVCNMGVVVEPDGTLDLEEKGTVYNEMVRSFEGPWGNLMRALEQALYGDRHPLALSSGGLPAAIREMTPADLRRFHGRTHHLNNMGSIVAIGDDMVLDHCLAQLSAILARVEPDARMGEDPATLRERMPVPTPAPIGEIRRVHFPDRNESAPAMLIFGWPARNELELSESYLLELFMHLLGSGDTSVLHRTFIGSQTQVIDLGATRVFAWVRDELGSPAFVGFENLNPERCDPETIERVRGLILDEIRRIAAFPDGSAELAEFNARALNRIIEERRQTREFLNTPPRFGYRGIGPDWITHLQRLHAKGGFRRNLAMVDELAAAEALVSSTGNPWRTHLARWGLLEVPPYAVATTANPSMIRSSERERRARIDSFAAELEQEYGVADRQQAIRRYQAEYDRKTRQIEDEAASIPVPAFVDDPPLSLDDRLDYEVLDLGGVPLVASTFSNLTSGTTGLAFRLDVVPEPYLVYVPALPLLMTEIGVIEGGEAMSYQEFAETLRREVLDFDAYHSTNFRTGRAELAIRAAGSDRAETERALHWLETALFSPNLRQDNLPRVRDAVDAALANARNRMRGREEGWVQDPARAYWRQSNPLLLHADCFLTQAHALHRLRWLLMEDGDRLVGFREFLWGLDPMLAAGSRDDIEGVLTTVIEGEFDQAPAALAELRARFDARTWELAVEAAKDLRLSLSDLPDATLASDLRYLRDQMVADLAVPPAQVLAELEAVLALIRHRDNVRVYTASNAEDRLALRPAIEGLLAKLDPSPSLRQEVSDLPFIRAHLDARTELRRPPIYVGLVNENTRSGVHIHTADCATFESTDDEAILRFLAARLYGGGGAHSMFMKTWGAGLAYSNGLRSDEELGRIQYYAERCPDLPQTLQFVIEELRGAPRDPSLAEYAVAQGFGGIRSGARYEERAEAMAADLADGLTPETVAAFRGRILELRGRPNFYDALHRRMKATYGEVLPGYGPSGPEAVARGNAQYFVIGPETQLRSWEEYLAGVEPGAELNRIYPRDYWWVRPPVTLTPGD